MATFADSTKDGLCFVEENVEDINCPICLEMLKNPHQVTCCGKHFCGPCIRRVRDSNEPCPMCKVKNYETFNDKNKHRRVQELQVDCTNKEKGCQWNGFLKDLSSHLSNGKREGDCHFEEVICPNPKCQRKKQRHQLDNHEKYECPPQPQCKYCKLIQDPYITEDHFETCPQYPAMVCPNRCQNDMKIHHTILHYHMLKECSLQPVECPFNWAGCTHKPLRKDIDSHTLDLNHLSLLAVACGQLKRENKQLTEACGQLAQKLAISTHQRERTDKLIINARSYPILPITIHFGSPPVHAYTHIFGQHISVLAYNGYMSRCVFLALHQDDFDEIQPSKLPKITVKIKDDSFPILTDTKKYTKVRPRYTC